LYYRVGRRRLYPLLRIGCEFVAVLGQNGHFALRQEVVTQVFGFEEKAGYREIELEQSAYHLVGNKNFYSKLFL